MDPVTVCPSRESATCCVTLLHVTHTRCRTAVERHFDFQSTNAIVLPQYERNAEDPGELAKVVAMQMCSCLAGMVHNAEPERHGLQPKIRYSVVHAN